MSFKKSEAVRLFKEEFKTDLLPHKYIFEFPNSFIDVMTWLRAKAKFPYDPRNMEQSILALHMSRIERRTWTAIWENSNSKELTSRLIKLYRSDAWFSTPSIMNNERKILNELMSSTENITLIAGTRDWSIIVEEDEALFILGSPKLSDVVPEAFARADYYKFGYVEPLTDTTVIFTWDMQQLEQFIILLPDIKPDNFFTHTSVVLPLKQLRDNLVRCAVLLCMDYINILHETYDVKTMPRIFGCRYIRPMDADRDCANIAINMLIDSKISKICQCGAPGKACSNCHMRYYCSRECQALDWPDHKMFCKMQIKKESIALLD